MWWTIVAMAGFQSVEEAITPIPRVWAAGGDCDASPLLVGAFAEARGGEPDDPAGTLVLRNLEALEKWRLARRCGRLGSTPSGGFVFQGFVLSRAASAEARLVAGRDAAAGTQAALGVLELGLDLSTHGVVGAAVGQAVWMDGLSVIEDHLDALDAEERRRTVRRTRRMWELRPGLRLDRERQLYGELVREGYGDGISAQVCEFAHGGVIDAIEGAMQQEDPLAAMERVSPSWLAGTCAGGITSVVADWLRDEAAIEARVLALEAQLDDR